MNTVLIIHGIEGHAGIHWQKWLYDELVKKGYKALMPDMPNPDKPDRKEWLKTLISLTKDIEPSGLIVVGHSLGVPSVLDFIETSDNKIKAFISVSGFAKDYSAKLNSYFLKTKNINFKKVNKNLNNAFVIYGDNDPYVPQEILKDLADELKVKPIIIKNSGHLNTNSGYTKFPKLLKLIETL